MIEIAKYLTWNCLSKAWYYIEGIAKPWYHPDKAWLMQ